MTDDPTPFGLGWIESPPDGRDWPVHALYAATGTEAPAVLPAAYHVPAPLYPVVDQGSSPMCVAYSAAGEQGWYDLHDTGLALFDEALFFRQIGGTANGAVIRDALARRLSTGYPPQGHPDRAASHRIAAYYAVPVARADLCAAILSFGPMVIGTPWASSWFHPVNGVLPAFDRTVGGHAILAVGWDATGLRLRNSWGAVGPGRRGHPPVGRARPRPRGVEGGRQDRAHAHHDPLAHPGRARGDRRPLRARRARPPHGHAAVRVDRARQWRPLRPAGREAGRLERPGDRGARDRGRVQEPVGAHRARRDRVEHHRRIGRGGAGMTLDTATEVAILAIVLGAVSGVLTAVFPSDATPWIVPVAGAITAIATLIKQKAGVDAPTP